jgi:hypothetical protein
MLGFFLLQPVSGTKSFAYPYDTNCVTERTFNISLLSKCRLYYSDQPHYLFLLDSKRFKGDVTWNNRKKRKLAM